MLFYHGNISCDFNSMVQMEQEEVMASVPKHKRNRIRNKLSRELKRNWNKGVMASPKVTRKDGKIKNRLSGSAKRYKKVREYGNYPQRKKIPLLSIVKKDEK